MKSFATIVLLVVAGVAVQAQSSSSEVQTIFRAGRPSGGYGAISNKFTSIYGGFANMPEVYGGWFINRKFLMGIGGGATTNYVAVPIEDSAMPNQRMSYLYGQAGLVNEWVMASNSPIHPVLHFFNGAGFSLQYERPTWNNMDDDLYDDDVHDVRWFYVTEPGIQVELNLLKWMRITPGVSYRFAFDNARRTLNKEVSGPSVNVAMKFGKF